VPPGKKVETPFCVVCKATNHRIHTCDAFRDLTVPKRRDVVKRSNLCYNCMWPNHTVQDCGSTYNCSTCKARHHTMLHQNPPAGPQGGGSQPQPRGEGGNRREVRNHHSSAPGRPTVVLATAKVNILNFDNEPFERRALLDSGSQSSFVSEWVVKMGRFLREADDTVVSGLGGQGSQKVNGKVELTLQLKGTTRTITVTALILQKVTGILPNREIDVTGFLQKGEIDLADDEFHIPAPIDLLLGADVYHDVVKSGKSREVDGFRLIKTEFGEAVSGPILGTDQQGPTSAGYVVAAAKAPQGIEKFWEGEEIAGSNLNPSGPTPKKHQSDAEKMAEKIYEETTTVAPDGRITVSLPFKEDADPLGYSRAQALKRLMNLKQKFRANSTLGANYTKAFQEMIDEGFMELVPEGELITEPGSSYYIPHHCVLKDSSTTTKLRIVFDGSAKTSSGQSINDVLLVGPTLQENLYNIMIRFRWHIVAVSGDITKMYLQVALAQKERDFHRVLWMDKKGNLLTYRMTRVTFGLGPSSHLSIKSLLKTVNLATSEVAKKSDRKGFLCGRLPQWGRNGRASPKIATRRFGCPGRSQVSYQEMGFKLPCINQQPAQGPEREHRSVRIWDR
jgi:hypothetical protein